MNPIISIVHKPVLMRKLFCVLLLIFAAIFTSEIPNSFLLFHYRQNAYFDAYNQSIDMFSAAYSKTAKKVMKDVINILSNITRVETCNYR